MSHTHTSSSLSFGILHEAISMCVDLVLKMTKSIITDMMELNENLEKVFNACTDCKWYSTLSVNFLLLNFRSSADKFYFTSACNARTICSDNFLFSLTRSFIRCTNRSFMKPKFLPHQMYLFSLNSDSLHSHCIVEKYSKQEPFNLFSIA